MVQNPYESPREAVNVVWPEAPARPDAKPKRLGDWLRYWGLRIGSCSLAGIFGFVGLVTALHLPSRGSVGYLLIGILMLSGCGCLLGLLMLVAGAVLNVFGT
jgi:hypothetical protein